MKNNTISGDEFSVSYRPSSPKPLSQMTSGELMSHQEWHKSMWAKLKQLRGPKCEKCEARVNQKTAVIHHKHYRTYLHETGEELVILCGDCHRDLHTRSRTGSLTKDDVPFIDPLWVFNIR